MSGYRYQLEKYNGMKTRYRCPSCEKSKKFTRYIDTLTNEYLHPNVGICNRKNKCGYHYSPKQYFQDNNISNKSNFSIPLPKKPPKPKTSYFNKNDMNKSVSSNKPNFFVDFLIDLWSEETAHKLVRKYNIGTSTRWVGATTFWQQDINGKVRTGKIMLYNPLTGKRVKSHYPRWEHKTGFNLEQCLFGEHLINEDKDKPIAICESEKTAVICSEYIPQFIWLATGGISNLSPSKTKVLKGRNIVLFPDVGGYDIWNNKISEFTSLATFRTSTLLEKNATDQEREDGLDIADYLLRIHK